MVDTPATENDETKRIAQTMIMRANYETSGGDTALAFSDVVTSGTALYDVSDSIGSDMFYSSGSRSGSLAVGSLDRDLNSFKKRIDANTEEQREHTDMMVGLQHKIEEYRRRIAETERQITTQKAVEGISFTIKEANDTWVPELNTTFTDYEWASRLDEERRSNLFFTPFKHGLLLDEDLCSVENAMLLRRNDELRMQIAQQQIDIQRLQKQFEAGMYDKEKMYQQREKNLAYYLNAEQRKMMDVMEELQRVRRQFADYKEQTERDLENQKNEVAKVTRNAASGTHRLSEHGDVGLSQDVIISEALQRFREQQAAPVGASVEDYNALMRKYEETVQRVIELESRGDGNSTKLITLEADLRRTKDKLAECLMFSGGTRVIPSEVYRGMRNVIRARDNQLEHVQRKLKNSDSQIDELTTRLEGAEETRRRTEKQLAEAKREINTHQRAVDDAHRELRRMEDRLRIVESEKIVAENARRQFEEEIRRLKMLVDQTAAEGERRALEEAEAQKNIVEDEYKTLLFELTRRTDALQDENKRLKSDLVSVKEKMRNLETEYNTALRKLEDKELALKHLEDAKGSLLKDLESQRARYDTTINELDILQANLETATKNTSLIEMTIKEVKLERDQISKEKDDLSRQLADVTHSFEMEIKKRENIERSCLKHVEDIDKLKARITEYEKQIMALRRQNDELDTRVKTGEAKITTIENSLSSAQTEIRKITELNDKLQKEKQHMMSSKQKVEAEMDMTKERIRKLELEIEKVKQENNTLQENEQKARQVHKEEENKISRFERELKEAKAEIGELKKALQQADEESKELFESAMRANAQSDEMNQYETTEITEVKVKELRDKHKLDLRKLENDKDDLERRLHLMEDEQSEKQHAVHRLETEIDELKVQYQLETDRLKAEMASAEIKYQSELDDEKDRHNRDVESLTVTAEELQNKISLMQKMLEEAKNRENILQQEVVDSEEKYDILSKEMQKLRDEMEMTRMDTDKDMEKWKTDAYKAQTEIKTVESANETLRSQLSAASERAVSLNSTINEQNVKIRELNTQLRRLEEELAGTKAAFTAQESDLENTTTKLHSVEEQNASKTTNCEPNWRQSLDKQTLSRQVLANTNEFNESEMERLKKKVMQLTASGKGQNEEIEKCRNERDQLDRSCREKTKELEQLKEANKTLESKVGRARLELQEISTKLIAVETDRAALRGEAEKLTKEVNLVKEQLQKKSEDFHAALDDVANAHRTSEDGRVNALHELEARKFEVGDLKSRLENSEQRLAMLQQEYVSVDKERDTLKDSMRRFQSIINRSMIIEGLDSSGSVSQSVDVSTIESHLQKLISRVDTLEKEKNEYRDSLDRIKNRSSTSEITVEKRESTYRAFEGRLVDAEDGRRKAELKLASAKEVIKSQEETLKQLDEEKRNLKSKITAFELEARGKDAQIRHLNEMLKAVQVELENSQNDNRALREREEQWETSRIHLEQRVSSDDGESRVKVLMATFEAERQNLSESLKKLTSELQASENKNADLKDDAERLRRDLLKAERVEVELRRNLEDQTRITRENQQLRDQLGHAQSDLANANGRKQQLEGELAAVRAELRDQKQYLHDAANRTAELQRQLQDTSSEKSRLSDRIAGLEKISVDANERKTLLAELEEMRRRTAQMENEKRTVSEKMDETNRVCVSLTKKIEILEAEKHSAELLIHDTASQRAEIERSLSAMERENKELNKNCAQLQQQIAQLEMDNGDRLIALTNKQKEEHDKFVQAVKAEKIQVERIVESRDRAQRGRIRQLENQVSILREQLNSERARAGERVMVSERSRTISTSSYGVGSNAAGAVSTTVTYPQTDSFDYVFANQSALSSYYTVPSQQHISRNIGYRASSTTWPNGVNNSYSPLRSAKSVNIRQIVVAAKVSFETVRND
ncbi:unnamed protein product [Toxocara canis]|uniref:Major antigen n=1 Tax=Toxocara canis TaxID=6265 RepID=A0A183UNX0_TOXCA|nr:unnamed protein product [Toxocara canis]